MFAIFAALGLAAASPAIATSSSLDDRAYWPAVDSDPSHGISAGRNAMVSADDADAMHAELYIGADPANAQRLVACSFATTVDETPFDQSGQWDNIYASLDGGASWHLERRSNSFGGDPSCEYGKGGRAYWSVSAAAPSTNAIYHSDDGGLHWSGPVFAARGPLYTDNSYFVPDPFIGGKFGRLYVAGEVDEPLPYSDDGGASFHSFTFKTDKHEIMPGRGAVLTDGTLVWPGVRDYAGRHESMYPVPGKPNSWIREWIVSPSGAVRRVNVARAYHFLSFFGTYYMDTQAAADDSAMFRDRIYSVWTDSRGGRGQILLAISADRGKTWTHPFIIDDDKTGEDFTPMMAVNKNGVVGVAWYDRRDNPDEMGWYIRFRASLDGGATWLPSVRVSNQPNAYSDRIDPRNISIFQFPGRPGNKPTDLLVGDVFLDFHLAEFHPGDYSGMAVDANGDFHPVWIDNRTGVPNIWTAAVHVTGIIARRPLPNVRSLIAETPVMRVQHCEDEYGPTLACGYKIKTHIPVAPHQITSPVSLFLSGLHYDPGSHVVSVWARIQNLSDHVLKAPLQLELVDVASALGNVDVTNAENGKTKRGAAWNLLQDAAPHEYTDAAYLQFRLSDIHKPRRGRPSLMLDGTPVLAAFVVTFRARLIRAK